MMADNDICLKEIGQRIIERRKKLGLTQEALAEKGDMTTQFISYAELGKRAMRPENLLKICTALDVSADYLLTGDVVDKDLLILSDKLRKLSPSQLRIIENVIDECNALFNSNESSAE
ncbi:hypothetical protein SDC9_194261 [bioreactor metagenome]|uniref:HTH cro/C1-type domain-containing protein n=1 Tax=bioreactor metagenome TaxID=1076179 RepID=A0A645I5S6_9ZZZZ